MVVVSVKAQKYINIIQLIFIFITIILSFSFFCGCISKKNPNEVQILSQPTLDAIDNAGISTAIRNHLGQSLGQIIAIENYNQVSATAIVTITIPEPKLAKVYLLYDKKSQKWIVERVQKNIDKSNIEHFL